MDITRRSRRTEAGERLGLGCNVAFGVGDLYGGGAMTAVGMFCLYIVSPTS